MRVGAGRQEHRRDASRAAPLLTAPRATALGWVVGVATTVLVAGTPYLVFGLHSRTAHLLLDTVDACIALLLTYLLWGRFARGRRLQDLLLAQGLFVLAAAGTAPPAAVTLLGLDRPAAVAAWSAVVMRVAGALLLLASALVGRHRLVRGAPRGWTFLPLLGVAAVVVSLWFVKDGLPAPVPQNPPASATNPVVSGHSLLLAGQLAGAAAMAVASIGFTVQATRSRDPLLPWLGPACALAASARVSYFLYPSLYSDWVYAGDLLRTASYVVLLLGAAREISNYWSAWALATVLDDRRRLARELHDGVVQELGYIRSAAQGSLPDDALRGDLLGACDRALDEARAAVDALGRSPDEPLGFAVHRAAQHVADRYGGRVTVDLDDSVQVDQTRRHALVRITREAVSNAIRHGEAQSVRILLVRTPDGGRLVVEDDGRGFEPRAVETGAGYGLTSMRERAGALPGSLELTSVEGRGTMVAVTWSDRSLNSSGRRAGQGHG